MRGTFLAAFVAGALTAAMMSGCEDTRLALGPTPVAVTAPGAKQDVTTVAILDSRSK